MVARRLFFCPNRRFVKDWLFVAHFNSFEIQTVFSPCSKSFSVLRGEDFGVFSLDIHVSLSMKKVENLGRLRRKMSI